MADAATRSGLVRLAAALLAYASFPAAAGELEPLPRLTGIVIAGQERLAIFAGEPTLVVREGDQLGNERVTAIEARTVHLDGPDGPRLIVPADDLSTRAAHALSMPPPSVVDPYWRELETENDQ